MRIARIAAALVLTAAAVVGGRAARGGDDIPEPRLDRVDYAHPEKYLGLPATLGTKAGIEKIAGEVRGATPRDKLAGIGAWIDAHLTYDASTFDRWRDVDELVSDRTFGGCADHAELFGAIARACGIPTVWVKSLDLDWIAWFRAHPDEPKGWNGHVFVEVHVDGKWRLYDASQKVLYEDYDVRQRILPGHRLAYDKGGDPYELLLSTRWDDWRKQTRRFVQTLDISLVPVGEAPKPPIDDPPGRTYVAATHPAWQWVVDRCNALHLTMGSLSGNGGWERWLPSARRGILIVPAVNGKTVLPETYWPLLPVQPPQMTEALGGKPSAVVRRKAADGTDVVLVMARDDDALRAALAVLSIESPGGADRPAPSKPQPGPRAGDGATARTDAPGSVYVVANSPECYWVADRCKSLGRTVGTTGNCEFQRWVPNARSGVLIVVSLGGETVLTGEYRSLLPQEGERDREALKSAPSAVVRKKAADGTDVVLLIARDKDALKAALETFTLDAPR
jgi:transglutaminase-like putative cysteine protease